MKTGKMDVKPFQGINYRVKALKPIFPYRKEDTLKRIEVLEQLSGAVQTDRFDDLRGHPDILKLKIPSPVRQHWQGVAHSRSRAAHT